MDKNSGGKIRSGLVNAKSRTVEWDVLEWCD